MPACVIAIGPPAKQIAFLVPNDSSLQELCHTRRLDRNVPEN